jgi:hypothetical protein
MPMYPAVALLSARTLLAADAGRLAALSGMGVRLGRRVWLALGLVLLLGSAAALTWPVGGSTTNDDPSRYGIDPLLGALLVALMVPIILRVGLTLFDDQYLRPVLLAVLGTVVWSAMTLQILLPERRVLWISSRISEGLSHMDSSHIRPIAVVDYQEDSLLFLTRSRAQRVDRSGFPTWLNEHPDGLVVLGPSVSREEEMRFKAMPWPSHATPEEQTPIPWTELAYINGWNYTKGRIERLVIVGRRE